MIAQVIGFLLLPQETWIASVLEVQVFVEMKQQDRCPMYCSHRTSLLHC